MGNKLSKPTIALLDAKKTVAFMQGAFTELGFDKIMAQRGMTAAQGKACLADKVAFDAVIGMTEEAVQTLKIKGTPTVMINGKIIDGHEFSDIKQHISN
jgi:DNA-binding phage protein